MSLLLRVLSFSDILYIKLKPCNFVASIKCKLFGELGRYIYLLLKFSTQSTVLGVQMAKDTQKNEKKFYGGSGLKITLGN